MKERSDIVTVVTVVYNGKSFIEDTIKSVLNQTYPYIEYLIFDGGSTDGTVDIIKKYSNRISYWVSQPDKGIYDAMNKAIDKASGKWINFMNAGDFFYSCDAVKNIFTTDIDIDNYATIYGDAEFRLKNIAYIHQAADQSSSNGFMPFSHQAAFVKSDVAKKTKFDLTYRITADTAFFLRLIKEGNQFCRIPTIVCSYDALDGLSVNNDVKRTKELIDMQVKLNGADGNSAYFQKQMHNASIKERIKKILPQYIWIKLREASIKKKKQYRLLDGE